MKTDKLGLAIVEAQRFLSRAEPYYTMLIDRGAEYSYSCDPKETGAIRRSSMDLTRALAELRKPDQ